MLLQTAPIFAILTVESRFSLIPLAEQHAVDVSPLIYPDLIAVIQEFLDSPADLYRCSLVSKSWATVASSSIMKLCGRMDSDGKLSPDFSKILRNPQLSRIAKPYDLELQKLTEYLAAKNPNQMYRYSLKSWARHIVSALPFIMDKFGLKPTTCLVEILLDMPEYSDLILGFAQDHSDSDWDGECLAWKALMKLEDNRVTSFLIHTARPEKLAALELAFSYHKRIISKEALHRSVMALETIPLAFLAYMCRQEAAAVVENVMRRGILVEADPDDVDLFEQVFDLGPVGVEIARYIQKFDALAPAANILLAEKAPDLFRTVPQKLFPLIVGKALCSDTFGQPLSIITGCNEKLSAYPQLPALMEKAGVYAYRVMDAILQRATANPTFAKELLLRVCATDRTFDPENSGVIDQRPYDIALGIVEHPVFSNSEKWALLLDPAISGFVQVNVELSARMFAARPRGQNRSIGFLFCIRSTLSRYDGGMSKLRSIWKYIYDDDRAAEMSDTVVEKFMSADKTEVNKRILHYCWKLPVSNEWATMQDAVSRNFLQKCIKWGGITNEKLYQFLAKQPAKQYFMRCVNYGITPAEPFIARSFEDAPARYKTLMDVSSDQNLGRYAQLLRSLDK